MEDGVTHAMLVNFNKMDLLELVHKFDEPIGLKVGTSFVHPNDVYTKSIGRQLSSSRLSILECKFSNLESMGDKIYLNFVSNAGVQFTFRVNKYSDKVHFVNVNSF